MIERIVNTLRIPSELNEVRERLDYLPSQTPDYPIGISGIKLIQRSTDRPNGEDCQGFVFGNTDGTTRAMQQFISEAKRTRPEQNAIAVYSNTHETIRHVGLVVNPNDENGKVIIRSKWGLEGHLYEHDALLVPKVYGSSVSFYKK